MGLAWRSRDVNDGAELAEVLANEVLTTPLAACSDIGKQGGRIGASRVPALVEVGLNGSRILSRCLVPLRVNNSSVLARAKRPTALRVRPSWRPTRPDSNIFAQEPTHRGIPLACAYRPQIGGRHPARWCDQSVSNDFGVVVERKVDQPDETAGPVDESGDCGLIRSAGSGHLPSSQH